MKNRRSDPSRSTCGSNRVTVRVTWAFYTQVKRSAGWFRVIWAGFEEQERENRLFRMIATIIKIHTRCCRQVQFTFILSGWFRVQDETAGSKVLHKGTTLN